jgi:predicted 3-demethylubiquinone-9 3-methyltransferase (glyoxalase superfamily)
MRVTWHPLVSKNTICYWYDGTMLDAANFHAETVPDSTVDVVHRVPDDYPPIRIARLPSARSTR